MKAALTSFDLRCASSSEPYLDPLRMACRSLCFHPESIAFHGLRLTGTILEYVIALVSTWPLIAFRSHAYGARSYCGGCRVGVRVVNVFCGIQVSHCAGRYIAAELLEIGSKNADLHRRPVITARDICLAIRQDAELQQCFGACEIDGGRRVNPHNVIVDREFQLKQ